MEHVVYVSKKSQLVAIPASLLPFTSLNNLDDPARLLLSKYTALIPPRDQEPLLSLLRYSYLPEP